MINSAESPNRHETILKFIQKKMGGTEQAYFLQQMKADSKLQEEVAFMQMMKLGAEGLGKKHMEEERKSIDQIKIPEKAFKIDIYTIMRAASVLFFSISLFAAYYSMRHLTIPQKNLASRLYDIDRKQDLMNEQLCSLSAEELEPVKLFASSKNIFAPLSHGEANWKKVYEEARLDIKKQNQIIGFHKEQLIILKSDLKEKDALIETYCSNLSKIEEQIKRLHMEMAITKHHNKKVTKEISQVKEALENEKIAVQQIAENSFNATYRVKKRGREYSVFLDDASSHRSRLVKEIDLKFHVSHSMIANPNKNKLVLVEIFDEQKKLVSPALAKEVEIYNYIGRHQFRLRNKLKKGLYYIQVSHNGKELITYSFNIT